MTNINIKAFFKFSKVKWTEQILDNQSKAVFVTVKPKKRFAQCGIVVEDLELALPEMRVSRRLARYILDLCNLMTIKEVAKYLEPKSSNNLHLVASSLPFSQEILDFHLRGNNVKELFIS